jgi:hypothetical protein
MRLLPATLVVKAAGRFALQYSFLDYPDILRNITAHAGRMKRCPLRRIVVA